MYSSRFLRGLEGSFGDAQLGDAAAVAALHDLSRSWCLGPLLSPRASSNLSAIASPPLQFGGLAQTNVVPLDMVASSAGQEVEVARFCLPRGGYDNWGDSGVLVASPRTDTSTDVETEEKNPLVFGSERDGSGVQKERTGDQKNLRRLAQNREAARRSRMRKKAYVQQLESSRLKLMQLEQELQRTRSQNLFVANGCSNDYGHPMGANGVLAFDMEYARWLDEHQRQINELRSALNSHVGDEGLRLLVDAVMTHYDEFFKLKNIGTKCDVFHMLSGMWTTPAERCFMWLGGFRSSELLKILANHLEPLTEQQLMGICNLQQSSQQAEDALSQGMEALQQSLAETLASTSLTPSSSSDNVTNYMSQMAIAMGKLGTLENFLRQADLLRLQTLQQMHRILTTRQAARALLAINDYFSRLRALSSLWLARPRD